MKRLFSLSFILLLVISFNACKKKTTTAAYTPSCGSTMSYSVNVKPLIQSSCASCHSSYSSYSSLKASAASVRSSIVNGSMPKGTTLTTDQKNSIVCWIDAGSPNN